MPIAHINGVDLAYEEYGDGFPLIWAHEFAGSMESWLPQVNFFSRRYRVIVYNARGYPPSTVPAEASEYGQDYAVEDLYGLLKHSASSRHTSAACRWAAPAHCISVSDTTRWRVR